MNKPLSAEDRIKGIIDRGAEHIDEVLEMLLDEAKGVHFVVSPKADRRGRPTERMATLVTVADEVEKVCKKCKQPILAEPPVVWEVWKERRDTMALKFLYEQFAGRAKTREKDRVDPELIIVFGDIDSVASVAPVEIQAIDEGRGDGLNGSSPRTPLPKPLPEEEIDELGIDFDLGDGDE